MELSAISFKAVDCGEPARETEFNEWYNTDHIYWPMKSPLIQAAERYERLGGDNRYPKYFALYRLENEPAFQAYSTSPERKASRAERDRCWPASIFVERWRVGYTRIARWGDMEVSTAWRMMGSNCNPAREAEYADWYSNRLAPLVMQSPSVIAIERYKLAAGQTGYPRYLDIYGFKDSQSLMDYSTSPIETEARCEMFTAWPKEDDLAVIWRIDYKQVVKVRK